MPTGSRLGQATGGTYSGSAVHHDSMCRTPLGLACAAEPERRISLLALLSRRRATCHNTYGCSPWCLRLQPAARGAYGCSPWCLWCRVTSSANSSSCDWERPAALPGPKAISSTGVSARATGEGSCAGVAAAVCLGQSTKYRSAPKCVTLPSRSSCRSAQLGCTASPQSGEAQGAQAPHLLLHTAHTEGAAAARVSNAGTPTASHEAASSAPSAAASETPGVYRAQTPCTHCPSCVRSIAPPVLQQSEQVTADDPLEHTGHRKLEAGAPSASASLGAGEKHSGCATRLQPEHVCSAASASAPAAQIEHTLALSVATCAGAVMFSGGLVRQPSLAGFGALRVFMVNYRTGDERRWHVAVDVAVDGYSS